jgi:hypothetical protein
MLYDKDPKKFAELQAGLRKMVVQKKKEKQ